MNHSSGISTEMFILYRFLTTKKPFDHRKKILLDGTFSDIISYSVIFGYAWIKPILLLIVYFIIGYLIGLSIQYNCEFKLSRFSRG
jgi:hypothetical protein